MTPRTGLPLILRRKARLAFRTHTSEECVWMAVGIYVRVSTEEQRERQSILTQREFGLRYCDLHQLPGHTWRPIYRRPRAGPSLRMEESAPRAGILSARGADYGAGHRREYGCFRCGEFGAAEAPRVSGCGSNRDS